jgi:hypothetical protein
MCKIVSMYNTIAAMVEPDNDHQPVKRTRALEASDSPGIAGRVCDEW